MVQCVGSVITYLRRYSLAAFVGMTQVDHDGSYTEHTPAPRQETPPPRPSLPPRPPQESRPDGITQEQATKVWSLAKALWPEAPKDGVVEWLVANNYPSRSAELSGEQAAQVIRALEGAVQL